MLDLVLPGLHPWLPGGPPEIYPGRRVRYVYRARHPSANGGLIFQVLPHCGSYCCYCCCHNSSLVFSYPLSFWGRGRVDAPSPYVRKEALIHPTLYLSRWRRYKCLPGGQSGKWSRLHSCQVKLDYDATNQDLAMQGIAIDADYITYILRVCGVRGINAGIGNGNLLSHSRLVG